MYLFCKSKIEEDYLNNLSKVFLKHNVQFDKYCIYYLGDRGLIAEIEPLVRCIIFCIKNSLQLIVNSEFFSYSTKGWESFFENFWGGDNKIENLNKDNIKYRIFSGFNRDKRSLNFKNDFWTIMSYKTNNITVGKFSFNQYQAFHQTFYKMIFKLKNDIYCEVLKLSEIKKQYKSYNCLHIRRGDKVKGVYAEDIYYPTSLYLKFIVNNKNPIFIMSDDYNSVKETKNLTSNNTFTICPNYSSGFNIGQIREKKSYFNHNKDTENKLNFDNFTKKETILLLAELYIAFHSEIFIGTKKSNVSSTINLMRVNYKSKDISKDYLITKDDIIN